MKLMLSAFCTLLAVSALLCGCGRPSAARPESLQEKAVRAFHEAVTNKVVGFSRVIDWSFSDLGTQPVNWRGKGSIAETNWTAEATVEFINHQGGTDRTNLPFCFTLSLDVGNDGNHETNVMASIDATKIYHRQMDALTAPGPDQGR